MPVTPSLSIQLRSFAAADPGSWQALLDQARAADDAGIGKVVVSDHVAFGPSLDDYGNPQRGGIAGGQQPTGPDGHWLEPITVLGVLSGLTQHVRLGTNILLAALRRPVVLAKQLATLDVLSEGRVDLGVGVGWQEAEYEACGVPFGRRGEVLDATLEICRRLWTETEVSYSSTDLTFSRIHAMPKPRQAGGVPIWVSGTVNPRSMRRLASFGNGWIPWGPDAADIVSGAAAMRQAVDQLGRDPATIQIVGTLRTTMGANGVDVAATMDQVPGLRDAGVTDFRISPALPADQAGATEILSAYVDGFRAALDG